MKGALIHHFVTCALYEVKIDSIMAIYHLSAKLISRSAGRSATGAAAYRAGECITDERTGLVFDYGKKHGIDHREIMTPNNAPEWTTDRAKLWNTVEHSEKRKDSQVAREVEVALPTELNLDQQRELLRDFIKSQFTDAGMVADVAIHHAKGDNPHAHILLTMRSLGPDGFGPKNRDWNSTDMLERWRESWQQHTNKALENVGLAERIDHRTLAAQGIDRLPQIHIGPHAIEMEARGIRTIRGTAALKIEMVNAKIEALQTENGALEHERNYAIAASTEPGAISDRNRTASASVGITSRRDAADAGRRTTSKQDTRRELDTPAADSSRSVDSSGSAHRTGSNTGRESSSGRNVATTGSHDSGRNLYGGASDRLVALAGARTDHDARRAGGSQKPETGTDRGVEGAAVTTPDRTYLAVRRQLDAMGCDTYEIGIRDKSGRMLNRTWSKADVLKAVPWLKRENAKGSDVYVRPAGEKNQGLVLVDDLTLGQINRMKADGLAPALVVETSPANHQAWVRVSSSPIEPKTATLIAKTLASQYEADPNSADWRHFGRLAGFTNRKPIHTTENGRNPWVLAHEAPGKVAERGLELVQKAIVQVDRQSRVEASKTALECTNGGDPIQTYRIGLKACYERFGANMDVSKADYMVGVDMARKGFKPDQIGQAIEQASPELPIRKTGHEADYVARTVEAIMNHPDVVKKQQAQITSKHGKTL